MESAFISGTLRSGQTHSVEDQAQQKASLSRKGRQVRGNPAPPLIVQVRQLRLRETGSVPELEKSGDHSSLGQMVECPPQMPGGSLESPLPNSTPQGP